MAADRKFVPRVEPVYAWLYLGQPKREWPRWFKVNFDGMFGSGSLDKHQGRYAVATIDNERKTFWRWFDAETFRSLYVEEPRP